MEKKKFGNIKDMLTRDQMKQIKGGCGSCSIECLGTGDYPDVCRISCGPYWVCGGSYGYPGACQHLN